MARENPEQSDPGFRIVDKRQASSADRGEQPSESAAQGPPAADAEAHGRAEETAGRASPDQAAPTGNANAQACEGAAAEAPPPMEPADVNAIVEYCMSVLSGQAWQWMGLVVNPLTRKAERDLEQARVAIDCVEALFRQVESRLPQAQARQFRQVLTVLRVNFVRQSSPTA